MTTGPSGIPADGGSRTQASSPAEIVDLFNRYFVSDPVTVELKHHPLLKSLTCLIGTSVSDPVTCKLVDEEDSGFNVDLTLSDFALTVTQVLGALADLDASKATGPDEIPVIILKETA